MELEEGDKHRNVGEQEGDQREREEGPEEVGDFGAFGGEVGNQDTGDRNDEGDNAGPDGDDIGDAVFVALSPGLGESAVFGSVGYHGVDAEAPRGDVGNQGVDEETADNDDDGFGKTSRETDDAEQGGVAVKQTGVSAELFQRDGNADTEAGEQVENCNQNTTKDDGFGDFFFRVGHIVAESGDHFKAEHIEDNQRDKAETSEVNAAIGVVEREQVGEGSDGVGAALSDQDVDAEGAETSHEDELHDGTEVRDPGALGNT